MALRITGELLPAEPRSLPILLDLALLVDVVTTLEMQVSVRGAGEDLDAGFANTVSSTAPPLSRGPGHLALREGGEFLSPAEAV